MGSVVRLGGQRLLRDLRSPPKSSAIPLSSRLGQSGPSPLSVLARVPPRAPATRPCRREAGRSSARARSRGGIFGGAWGVGGGLRWRVGLLARNDHYGRVDRASTRSGGPRREAPDAAQAPRPTEDSGSMTLLAEGMSTRIYLMSRTVDIFAHLWPLGKARPSYSGTGSAFTRGARTRWSASTLSSSQRYWSVLRSRSPKSVARRQ